MLVYRGFKFRLSPTFEQETILRQMGGNARFLYNRLLTLQEETKKATGKRLSKKALVNSIPSLKKEYEFLSLSNAQSLQQVAIHLCQAYTRAYLPEVVAERNRRIAAAQTPKEKANAFAYGFPTYKEKRNFEDSFAVPQSFRVTTEGVVIPKMSEIKWIAHRELEGIARSLTITLDGEQWYCSVLCEIEVEEPVKVPLAEANILAIDLGLKTYASCSDRSVIENPRLLRKEEKKVQHLQRSMSRKQEARKQRSAGKPKSEKERPGKNERKDGLKLHRLHRTIRNRRLDFLHQETSRLIAKYDGFILETLAVKNLMKRPAPRWDDTQQRYLPNGASRKSGLSKSIADAGWSMFVAFLLYKSARFGKWFQQVDRWFPSTQTCGKCHCKQPMTLKARIYECENCGHIEDRDFNSSDALLIEGMRLFSLPPEGRKVMPGEPTEVQSAVSQELSSAKMGCLTPCG